MATPKQSERRLPVATRGRAARGLRRRTLLGLPLLALLGWRRAARARARRITWIGHL